MRKLAALLLALLASVGARAWHGSGHRAVAYITYKSLSPAARRDVDTILRSHPDYKKWVAGIPEGAELDSARALAAFLRASTWPDDIRDDPRFQSGPRPGDNPNPAPNPLGIPDTYRHENWHYINQPLIGDFSSLQVDTANTAWRNPPNVLSQIQACRAAVADASKPASARAYYLAWLLHLVGDVHQPLHCVARIARDPATGQMKADNGGNGVLLAGPLANLHAFWDSQPDSSPALPSVIVLGNTLIALPVNPADKKQLDEEAWLQEGTYWSIHLVYRDLAGLRSQDGRLIIPRDYGISAADLASYRIALAGYRLAAILNASLVRK